MVGDWVGVWVGKWVPRKLMMKHKEREEEKGVLIGDWMPRRHVIGVGVGGDKTE